MFKLLKDKVQTWGKKNTKPKQLFLYTIAGNTTWSTSQKLWWQMEQTLKVSNLQHPNFSHGNLLDERVILWFHKLFDGHEGPGVFVPTFEHHSIGALPYLADLLILIHVHCYSTRWATYTESMSPTETPILLMWYIQTSSWLFIWLVDKEDTRQVLFWCPLQYPVDREINCN